MPNRLVVRLIAPALLAAFLLAGHAPGAQAADPAARRFLAANALFQRQLYKLAAEEYAMFLAESPEHPDAPTARYALAVCHFRTGQPEKAVPLLEQVAAQPGFKQADEALLALAHCQIALKQPDKAMAALDLILKDFPATASAETAGLNRAQLLYLAKRYKEAAEAATAFLNAYAKSDRRADALYFLALAQRDQGQQAEAAASLRKMLDEHPKSPLRWDAMLVLGQLMERLDKLAQAADAYAALAQGAPAGRQADGWFALGTAQYRRKDYPGAIRAFSAVLAADPPSPHAPAALYQKGLAEVAGGLLGEARKTLAAVIERDAARKPQAQYWLAQCDIAERKYAEALAILDELDKPSPPPELADHILFDRARCLMGSGQYAPAAKAYESFAATYPNDPRFGEAFYFQAFCLHKSNQREASLALCRKIMTDEASPHARPARELAAENLFLLGQYEPAAAFFEPLLAGADPARTLRFTVRLGQCAYFSGHPDKAIAWLAPVADDPALLADPQLARALLLLGDALLAGGKNAESVAVLSRYASAAPAEDRPEALFKLAIAQARAGDDAAAQRTFAQVMKADSPWSVRAAFEHGQISYRRKQYDVATATLQGVADSASAPDDLKAAAAYLLAWIDLDGKKHESAAKRFRALFEKYPRDPRAAESLFYCGVALKESGADDQAVETFASYLESFPAGPAAPKARQLMAASLLRLKKHQEAIKALATLAADPKTVTDEVLYDLAWSQQAIRDSKGAEQAYRRLIADYPKSPLLAPARSELGELLFQRGEHGPAAELLEQAVATPNADPRTVGVAMYRLGSCYDKLAQHEKAALMFARFAEQRKEDELAAWAHYQAGVSFALCNQLDKARGHLELALASSPRPDLAGMALLKLGETLAEQHDFDASRRSYLEYLTRFGDQKLAHQAQFGIGWAMENQKKYDEARQWYQKAIAATNSPVAARAQFQIGETWFAEGSYEKAAANLLLVADLYAYPDWSARALVEAGRAFEQLKQFDQARAQYRQVIEKHKDQSEAAVARQRLAALESIK